jgi:hypothetical protein
VWQTWRSLLSIVIAYGLVVGLWVYSGDTLQQLVHWNSGFHDWLQRAIGSFSARGEAAFSLLISDQTTFITLTILFVRGVLLSTVLWVVNAWRSGVN